MRFLNRPLDGQKRASYGESLKALVCIYRIDNYTKLDRALKKGNSQHISDKFRTLVMTEKETSWKPLSNFNLAKRRGRKGSLSKGSLRSHARMDWARIVKGPWAMSLNIRNMTNCLIPALKIHNCGRASVPLGSKPEKDLCPQAATRILPPGANQHLRARVLPTTNDCFCHGTKTGRALQGMAGMAGPTCGHGAQLLNFNFVTVTNSPISATMNN